MTVGTLATEHITVDGTSIKFKNGGNVEAELKDGTLTLGGPDTTTADAVVLDGSSVSIYGNDADTGIFLTDDQIEIKGDGNNDKVTISNDGFTITAGGATAAEYKTTSKIFDVANSNTYTEVGNNGIIFVSGSITGSEFGHANGKFTASFFGAADKQERVEITDDGMEVYQGNTTRASIGVNTTITGGTITLQNSSTIFSEVSSVGLKIFKGDATNPVSIFGTNVTIGEGNSAGSGEKHQILLDTTGGSTGVTVKDGDNVDIAFIGSSAEVAGRTMEGALPNTAAVRGIVTDGLTGNSLSITGSANVGGLVASGSVRNTSNGAATSVLIHAQDNSNTLFQVLTDGEVLARDNITAFKTSGFSSISDERLKTDIQPISQSLDRILKLEPTNFSWIENNEKDSGFIAQDVEKVIPEVVQETKGFVDIDSDEMDDTKYKTIAYSKLTIYLVDAIKELTKRVEDLEERFIRK